MGQMCSHRDPLTADCGQHRIAGSFPLLPNSSPHLSQDSQLASLVDTQPCPLSSGKGRGRQVIAVARTADVVIMMLDATKGEVQR